VKALAVSKVSLAIDDVAARLWEQRAQHDAAADETAIISRGWSRTSERASG
jgi:hypothetical protein